MKKNFFTALCCAGLLVATSTLSADVVVQWGDVDGTNTPIATGIVSSNPNLTATTTLGTAINPAVGAAYYPSATGHSPIFNGAASKNSSNTVLDTNQVQDNANHDRIRFVATGTPTQLHGMVAWDTFLTSANTLNSLNIASFSSNNADVGISFLVQQADNSWIASDAGLQAGGGNNFKTIADVNAAAWTTFNPLAAGVGGPTLTPVVTPNFVGFKSVGYYFTSANPLAGTSVGIQTGYFQANASAAIPEPGSLALLGLGALGLVARRRR